MPYVQCESRSLYCLAPESACSRSVQADCERGLSPKSRLCVVDIAVLATLECVVLPCVLMLCPGFGCVPRVFTYADWRSISGKW